MIQVVTDLPRTKKSRKSLVRSTYVIDITRHTSRKSRRSLLQLVPQHLFVLLFILSPFNNICGADNPRLNSSLDRDSQERTTADGKPTEVIRIQEEKSPRFTAEVLDQRWSVVSDVTV